MLLREFLYVDTDKVRGLLAQLEGGVSEGESETTRGEKRSGIGMKGLAEHYQQWGNERLVQKSLGDALFPALEEALESEGLLLDLSAKLSDEDYWVSGGLRQDVPLGALVRITAQGSLFDARYVAATFAGFATIYQGLQGLGAIPAVAKPPNQGRKPTQGRKPQDTRKTEFLPTTSQLEDKVPELGLIATEGDSFTTPQLRSIIRVSRGMFTPGLHLNLAPTDDDAYTVGARLQEGRQFLDSDPDILFARYGVGPQEWTLVGTVGHYASEAPDSVPDDPGLVDGNGRVHRARMANFVNGHLGYLGSRGFTDLPQYPGFSVVPLAVYRLTGVPIELKARTS